MNHPIFSIVVLLCGLWSSAYGDVEFEFAARMGGSSDNYGHGIAVDAEGNVDTTGTFRGVADFNPDPGATVNLTSAGSYDIFVQKQDASGAFVWAKNMGGERRRFW